MKRLRLIIYTIISVGLILSAIFLTVGCSNKNKKIELPQNTVKDFKTQVSELQTATPQTTMPQPTTSIKAGANTNSQEKFPILTYHSVTDNIWGARDLHVSPSEFENQIKYFKENNYTSLSFSEIKNANLYEKPVIITFDDGYEDNYTEAYPILKKYDFKATFFVITKNIGKQKYLKVSQIEEMEMSDLIDVESHTVGHPDLTKIDVERLEKELRESKEKLEKITKRDVNILAYPYGQYDEQVLEVTKKHYKYAVICSGGIHADKTDYTIKRLHISRATQIDEFAKIIDKVKIKKAPVNSDSSEP